VSNQIAILVPFHNAVAGTADHTHLARIDISLHCSHMILFAGTLNRVVVDSEEVLKPCKFVEKGLVSVKMSYVSPKKLRVTLHMDQEEIFLGWICY
jgi:hypothetical protein